MDLDKQAGPICLEFTQGPQHRRRGDPRTGLFSVLDCMPDIVHWDSLKTRTMRLPPRAVDGDSVERQVGVYTLGRTRPMVLATGLHKTEGVTSKHCLGKK